MRCYFHVKDGQSLLDDEGMELDDLQAIREEAIRSSAELLKSRAWPQFWSGEPWVLWVTDQPSGGGQNLLTLTFSARATE